MYEKRVKVPRGIPRSLSPSAFVKDPRIRKTHNCPTGEKLKEKEGGVGGSVEEKHQVLGEIHGHDGVDLLNVFHVVVTKVRVVGVVEGAGKVDVERSSVVGFLATPEYLLVPPGSRSGI